MRSTLRNQVLVSSMKMRKIQQTRTRSETLIHKMMGLRHLVAQMITLTFQVMKNSRLW